MKIVLIIILILNLNNALANVSQVEADAKAFGLGVHNSNKNKKYNATDVPGFQTANPDEVKYYGNTGLMEQEGNALLQTEENANTIIKVNEDKMEFANETQNIKDKVETFENEIENIYCTKGECTDYKNEGADTQGMLQTLTAVSTIQSIEKDSQKNKNKLRIFTGSLNSCTKDRTGYNDCCKVAGWGQGIGANCSAAEKNLSLKRGQKQCVYYRKYCSKKVSIGFTKVCVVDTEEYCCFGSNLNKIIAEGGRKQLGISLGPTRVPTGQTICSPFFGCMPTYTTEAACRGFTPEELQKINMDLIDFSEFTNSLNPSIENIDLNTIQNQINQILKP